jgi:hypothetical protein
VIRKCAEFCSVSGHGDRAGFDPTWVNTSARCEPRPQTSHESTDIKKKSKKPLPCGSYCREVDSQGNHHDNIMIRKKMAQEWFDGLDASVRAEVEKGEVPMEVHTGTTRPPDPPPLGWR